MKTSPKIPQQQPAIHSRPDPIAASTASLRPRAFKLGALVVGLAACATPLHGSSDLWDLGPPVPDAERAYPPQGMCVAPGGTVYFTNHLHDRSSHLYRLSGSLLVEARSTWSAKHPGGLAADAAGGLWAVDYRDNSIYVIDIDRSFAGSMEVVTRRTIKTGLGSASAITWVTRQAGPGVEPQSFLALSEFSLGNPAGSRTFLVAEDRIAELAYREPVKASHTSYRNGGYSQGLASDGRFMYESTSPLGPDRIDVYDTVAPPHRGQSRLGLRHVGGFAAPGNCVEQLAVDAERDRLIVSDECTFQFFTVPLSIIQRKFTSGQWAAGGGEPMTSPPVVPK